MMSVLEKQLCRWAKAPSETAEDKRKRAFGRIKRVIEAKFGSGIDCFLQGSYRNRTNVKLDSDVDIVVQRNLNRGRYSLDTFPQFKNDIQLALENIFRNGEVKRKNKCIVIQGNSYRVSADVVPCFVCNSPVKGIEFITDNHIPVRSFPVQHYQNGCIKNRLTLTKYKAIVRILKNIRNELIEQQTITDETMTSFFLESLVWNVPVNVFRQRTYADVTKNIIRQIHDDMRHSNRLGAYTEVSGLTWLFLGQNTRTPQQAYDFMEKARNFLEDII